MMRRLICCLLMFALYALAVGQPFHDFSEPFDGKNVKIEWMASNTIPSTIKVFKVIPTKFTGTTVSNLLGLANLTESNKKRPVANGVFLEKNVLAFGNRQETRSLEIVPSEGFVVLVNSEVISKPRVPASGVPARSNLLSFALNTLHKLDIKESEIGTNKAGKIEPRSLSEESDIYKDKASGKLVTNVLARWIWLNRQIEGVTVSGGGGASMKYGNDGKLAELDLTWRSVEPLKEIQVPNAAEFVGLINSGKTLIRTGDNRPFKTLTITNVVFYYWENFGSEPQKYIYPFVVLSGKCDEGGTASNVELFLPLKKD